MPNLSIIPARAVSDRNLTDLDVRLLCAIGTHTNPRGENCFAGSRTLAEEARMSVRAVYYGLKRLHEAGYVRKTKRTRPNGSDTSSIYDIILEDPDCTHLHTQGVQAGAGGGCGPVQSHNDLPLTASSSTGNLRFVEPGYENDWDFLLALIAERGGSQASWDAELSAAIDGMHGPPATPLQISQAIRHFAGNGEPPVLRLFMGYLRSSIAGPAEKPLETGSGGKAHVSRSRSGGKTLAANELIRRVRALPGEWSGYAGGFTLNDGWRDAFTAPELRVIKAFGLGRIHSDTNDGTLVSQLAKALEEV